MAKKGKKYQESAKLIDRTVEYKLNEASKLAVETARAKFDESVELHAKLGVDSRHADQQVRGTIVLPHGTGKDQKVAVFAKGEKAEGAKAARADFVGIEDLVGKVRKEGWLGFDVAVATPDMTGVVGRTGRILGPQGLTSDPKVGTVTMDVASAIKEIKAGKVEYGTGKSNIIHVPAGKVSFREEKITENINALMQAILKTKLASLKGKYIRSLTIAPTMNPGIKVNPLQFTRE